MPGTASPRLLSSTALLKHCPPPFWSSAYGHPHPVPPLPPPCLNPTVDGATSPIVKSWLSCQSHGRPTGFWRDRQGLLQLVHVVPPTPCCPHFSAARVLGCGCSAASHCGQAWRSGVPPRRLRPGGAWPPFYIPPPCSIPSSGARSGFSPRSSRAGSPLSSQYTGPGAPGLPPAPPPPMRRSLSLLSQLPHVSQLAIQGVPCLLL